MPLPVALVAYRPSLTHIFGFILVLSLGANIWLLKNKWELAATVPLQAKIQSFEATDQAEEHIIAQKTEDDAKIADLKEQLKKKQGKREVVYRDRQSKLTVPECAPGQDRVDAWNAIGMKESK